MILQQIIDERISLLKEQINEENKPETIATALKSIKLFSLMLLSLDMTDYYYYYFVFQLY
jgi:hypothetical protein